ncbi:hypothetical protein PILCRDRAFT_450224 [Piloderma croceum F 1598]|uniref:Uncharacterized protein n=1 Tax=Piloderma croceum (strain F 1598) TaxID=765440 RepID=A0A0C3B9U6_PILCF|nr:hypothetical protein PILCRDRAFT_450224 [Piloderma croceum F 1598]
MDSAKNRSSGDVDRLGSWVSFMLREQSTPGNGVLLEVVYMRGTQNEVTLQLSENADLGPLLGEHRWPEFLKSKPTNSSCTASYLLEYNYTVNGKPDNHNWADHYPESKPLFPAFKADITYPRAHYVDATRFGHLKSLVLPLPKERLRTPTPPPTDVSV